MLHWLMELLRSFGDWVLELVLAIAACALAYPVIRVGAKWRFFFRLVRGGYQGVARRSAIAYAGMGTAILGAVGLAFYLFGPARWAIGYGVIATILVALGWFGFIVVPEELSDAFE